MRNAYLNCRPVYSAKSNMSEVFMGVYTGDGTVRYDYCGTPNGTRTRYNQSQLVARDPNNRFFMQGLKNILQYDIPPDGIFPVASTSTYCYHICWLSWLMHI